MTRTLKRTRDSEVAQLRTRLDEAEQTLEAIRSGSVDALVVSDATGDRIFTLKGADHRYRQIVEAMTEGALIVNPQGMILYANLAFATLIEKPLERVLGSQLRAHVPGEAVPTFERLIDRARQKAAATNASLLTEQKREVRVHVSAAPDGDAENSGVCLIVTDLTHVMRESELRQRELSSALDEKSRLLEAALVQMPSALAAVNEKGHFTLVNRRAEELWGKALLPLQFAEPALAHIGGDHSKREMSRAGYQFLLDGRALRSDEWPIERSLTRAEEVRSLEVDVVRPDGAELSVRMSSSPIRTEDGSVVGAVAVFDDITAQKRMHAELAAERASLALLSHASVALASTLDFDEILERVASLAVPQLADRCCIYLYEAGSMRQVAAVRRSNDSPEILRANYPTLDGASLDFTYVKVLRTGETEVVDATEKSSFPGQSSHDRPLDLLPAVAVVSWMGVPLKRQSETIGVLSFSSTTPTRRYDASDVLLAEELGRRTSAALENARLYRDANAFYEAERHARDKAEEATRLKDEFLATLSHELRTPLNAILGWSRMLQSHVVPENQRDRAIDTIVRNAAAQQQLIEDLLDISRIISGKLRLQVEQIDINQIVEASLDVVRPAAAAKDVRLQVVLDPSAGHISGDAGRLQQVIWNLLTNAVKFTPKGGRVHITVQRRHSVAEISIADTGCGIAADFLPHVFDRFRQEDGAITRRAGGLGLGLAIVKNLVELHGGTISAHSDGENTGCTFVVKLPISPLRETPIPEGRPGAKISVDCPPELEGLKVLVVDDEPDARELVKTVLERCKAVVFTAASAAEAITRARESRPDVIVSDIGMPDEDGYSFIRRLRTLPREEGGRTPAIALTAYARSEDRTRALIAGFQSHAAKPIDLHELVVVVASLAGRF